MWSENNRLRADEAAAASLPPRVQADGLARAHRIAGVQLEADDVEWLSRGFRAYLASNGTLPLERCLRLPTGDGALGRARRDHWLRQAWDRVGDHVTPWQRSEKLAEAVRRFRSILWPRWRALAASPSTASQVDAALFEAFRSHDRVPATAMQLHNIALQFAPPRAESQARRC
jgi:hypothetical protein